MGFQTVLIHRARTLERVATGATVEGTREHATIEGPWMKVRLFPEETPETDSGARGGRRVLMKVPHVIVGIRDLEGNPVVPGDISPKLRVEVDAGALGQQVWQVTSDPQPLLTRTKLIGFYFSVRRVETAGSSRDAGGY